jgi:hypothetical protein
MNTLFDSQNRVLPGDVLLLRGGSILALGNRLGQRALRLLRPFHPAKFSHVALVINSTHIADAIPEEGIQIRKWDDVSSHYNLGRCVVARHPDLSYLESDPTRLLERVQYYYAQRYSLLSLPRRTVKHNKGVVCSQFVALVLHDLGLRLRVSTPMRVLPSDIDHATRDKNGWNQFPLSKYGWSAAPHQSLAKVTRLEVLGANPSSLIGLDERGDDEERDSIETTLTQFSDAIGECLASSMAETESILRAFAELDRVMLAAVDALAIGSEFDQQKPLLLNQESSGLLAEGCRKIAVIDLLGRWRYLYIAATKGTVKVLAEADSQERLVQHREHLSRQVADLTKNIVAANSRAEFYKEQLVKVQPILVSDPTSFIKVISLMSQGISSTLRTMDLVKDESNATILARLGDYANLIKFTLTPVLPELGERVGQQALDQLVALSKMDEQYFDWIVKCKPVLMLLKDRLAEILSRMDNSPAM